MTSTHAGAMGTAARDIVTTRVRQEPMLKKILIGLVVIVAAFIGSVALQPADFRVARTATISAPPAVVFAQVNDFHKWEAWSPWAKLDPAAKNTFEGAPASMTLTESRPHELIRIHLDFRRPFAATSIAEFVFRPEGSHTIVTWTMTGKSNFLARAPCLFMNMDRMVGGEFEKGLAQMRGVAEAAASHPASDRS